MSGGYPVGSSRLPSRRAPFAENSARLGPSGCRLGGRLTECEARTKGRKSECLAGVWGDSEELCRAKGSCLTPPSVRVPLRSERLHEGMVVHAPPADRDVEDGVGAVLEEVPHGTTGDESNRRCQNIWGRRSFKFPKSLGHPRIVEGVAARAFGRIECQKRMLHELRKLWLEHRPLRSLAPTLIVGRAK